MRGLDVIDWDWKVPEQEWWARHQGFFRKSYRYSNRGTRRANVINKVCRFTNVLGLESQKRCFRLPEILLLSLWQDYRSA
jgi:hypothetical protein